MDQSDGSGPRDQLAPYQVPPPSPPDYADFLSRLVPSWKHAWQYSSEPYQTLYPSNGFGNREEERNRANEGRWSRNLWYDPTSKSELGFVR